MIIRTAENRTHQPRLLSQELRLLLCVKYLILVVAPWWRCGSFTWQSQGLWGKGGVADPSRGVTPVRRGCVLTRVLEPWFRSVKLCVSQEKQGTVRASTFGQKLKLKLYQRTETQKGLFLSAGLPNNMIHSSLCFAPPPLSVLYPDWPIICCFYLPRQAYCVLLHHQMGCVEAGGFERKENPLPWPSYFPLVSFYIVSSLRENNFWFL